MRLLRGLWCCFLLFLFLSSATAQQGVTYHPNKQSYWYFLTPTGYGPPPKKNILQNGMLAASQYQMTTRHGNTNCIGLIPARLFGADFTPMWISTHARFPIGGAKGHPATVANLGGFYLLLPKGSGGVNDSDFSLFYLNFTIGSRENNVAIGGAIAPTGFDAGIRPLGFTLHGLTRLGRHSCLLTENYLINDRGTWIPWSMSGWRTWWGRTALDAGFLVTRIPEGSSASGSGQWLPIPWLAVHQVLRHGLINRGGD